MRGRKPKPTKQQIAEGDPRKRGVKKLDEKLKAEPIAARGLPEGPDRLGKIARQAWDTWKQELENMNLDCRPDAQMLEGACVNFERAVLADEMVAKHGLLIAEPVVNREGEQIGTKVKHNPAIAISNKAWRAVGMFCSEFGFSPVSRTRLSIEKKKDDGELLRLLSAPREKKTPTPTIQ